MTPITFRAYAGAMMGHEREPNDGENARHGLEALITPRASARAREALRVRLLLDAVIFDIRARCATAIYWA